VGLVPALVLALSIGLLLAPAPASGQSRGLPPHPATPRADIPRVPIARVLAISKPDLEIGVEDEDGPYLFGTITSAEIGGDGTIYVADYSAANIRAFDPRGRHLRTFGRRGRGPGEFSNPVSLLHDGDSTLYAIQSYSASAILTATADRMMLQRTFGPDQHYRSACVLDGDLIVAGWRDGRLLHVVGERGEPVRSFGEGWSADTIPAVREMANRAGGALTCDPATGRIVLVQGGGARIRSYSRNGQLVWESVLPDFRYTQYVKQGNGVAMLFPEDGAGRAMLLGSDRLLLQVARVDYARAPRTTRAPGSFVDPPVVSRTTYVLDAVSGRILSRSTDAPYFDLRRDGVALVVSKDPYPVVRRLRVSPVPLR
jgi:outer membrane protein assembly factor BamB